MPQVELHPKIAHLSFKPFTFVPSGNTNTHNNKATENGKDTQKTIHNSVDLIT
jgi:hypothetical protein